MGERGEAERRPEEELEPWEKEVRDAVESGNFDYALDIVDFIINITSTMRNDPNFVVVNMGVKELKAVINAVVEAIKTHHKALMWRDIIYAKMGRTERARTQARRRT